MVEPFIIYVKAFIDFLDTRSDLCLGESDYITSLAFFGWFQCNVYSHYFVFDGKFTQS